MPQSPTGINRWWSFEERPLPGIGKAMVNVGNGNVIVQADDVDVPERGIDLAFRRTYNSMSGHDAKNTDGSTPSVFGNGWTSTFDAHLAYNASSAQMSVYDIDGARYDYAANGTGWTAPAGVRAQLIFDGYCGYYWAKPTGTIYHFYSPSAAATATCPAGTTMGYLGRIYSISGRNHNNSLTFTYSWGDGVGNSAEALTGITVTHSDGQTLVLNFAVVSGTSITELQSVTRPDGAQVTYQYDTSGDLIEVDRPGNALDFTHQIAIATLPEMYAYTGAHLLQSAASPRYVWSSRNAPGNMDGDVHTFTYDSSSRVSEISDESSVNPTPNDGQSSQLQPSFGGGGVQAWYTEMFGGWGSGTTNYADSSGHATNWSVDATDRVTETASWTGSIWLDTGASWDANNNIITTTDARGNETTYAYDQYGDTLAAMEPQVSTSLGNIYPLSLYSYATNTDSIGMTYTNLVSYCDPNYDASHLSWSGSGAPPSCPANTGATGATQYVYDYTDSAEPAGRLSSTYTPLGYHQAYAYTQGSQGGDFGLPTSVTGDCMAQADGTQRCPARSFTYTANGNLATYNTGSGTWSLTYDSLNRPIQRTDPDGISSYTIYNSDGSVQETQSAYQRYYNTGVKYAYDADGNEAQEIHHYGSSTFRAFVLPADQLTDKWYDGDDRLIEVKQPFDTTPEPAYGGLENEVYTNPWITRYLYDLTQNGYVNFNGASVQAYGNLFETQELLPTGGASVTVTSNTQLFGGVANTVFQPMKGQAFDALDRIVGKYSVVNNTNSEEALTYDAGGAYGLETSDCNALDICSNFWYDARGLTTSEQFNDGQTPNRSYSYDPDGKVITAADTRFGTETYTYDADGRETAKQEANGGGLTSPATIGHEYYPDGELSKIDVTSTGITQNGLFTYSYRVDGKVQTEQINDAALASVGTTTLSKSYDAAGKLTAQTESGPAATTGDSFTYDPNYGFMTEASYAGNGFQNYLYDVEGNVLLYSSFGIGANSQQAAYSYSVRNELLDSSPGGGSSFANGVAPPQYATNELSGTVSWDDRLGIATGENIGNGGTSSSTMATTIDAAGRTTVTATNSSSVVTDKGGNEVTSVNSLSDTRSYDALNRLISDAKTSAKTSPVNPDVTSFGTIEASYGWGVDNHPVLLGTSVSNSTASQPTPAPITSSDTLHWDGSLPLFETNASGQVDEIFVGTRGAILPLDSGYAGLTWFDRNSSGQVTFCHNATGSGVAEVITTAFVPENITCGGNGLVSGTMPSLTTSAGGSIVAGAGGVVTMPRADGITDGVNTIQGVRAYDSTLGSWTTPDADPGDAASPISLHSYAWNNNNPIAFSDPSGNIPIMDYYKHDPETGLLIEDSTANGMPSQALLTWNPGNLSSAPPQKSCPSNLPIIADVSSSNWRTSLESGGVWLYYAVETKSGKPYWGITNDIVRRGWEQARNGRVIRGFIEFTTRLAARGGEQTAENASGLENLENIRNSIAPGSPVYERAMAAMEEDSPGIGETISAAAQALIQLAGEAPP